MEHSLFETHKITLPLVCVFALQAWKKRWFVLRSGRLTGDPDVLEYYKNDHAKKPIRVIDLNLCEQVWCHMIVTPCETVTCAKF